MHAGDGILAIWNDVEAGREGAFVEWHTREHMPERLAVPGFRRGRRLFGADAVPRWITIYEADTTGVFESPAYLERLANPTPGTRAILPAFRATERMIGVVAAAAGRGTGGALAVLRIWGADMETEIAVERLSSAVAEGRPAIACSVVRSTGARQRTEEMRLRGGDLDAPDLVLLAELYARDNGSWPVPDILSAEGNLGNRQRLDIYAPEYELRQAET